MKFTVLWISYTTAIYLSFTMNICYAAITSEEPLPIYFVNMESQVERRATVTQILRDYGYKSITAVKAFVKKDFDFEILQVEECRKIPVDGKPNTYKGTLQGVPHIQLKSKKVIIDNLCFRKKGRNALVELAVLFSHLHAIYLAVHSDHPSKYAIILEDDFVLPFHVNITSLINIAPSNFALLQLITSSQHVVENGLAMYQKTGQLFIPRPMHAWCLGAYLIDIEKFKPFIDKVFTYQEGEGKPIVNLFVAQDCDFHSFYEPPTVCSPHRMAADYTIFHVLNNQTYISTLPLAESINSKLQASGGKTGIQVYNKESLDKTNLRTLAYVNSIVAKMKAPKSDLPPPPYCYQIEK